MSLPTGNNGAPNPRKASEPRDPEKPICSKCKNSQIRFIGLAQWDDHLQYFDFEPVLLDAFCLTCLAFIEVTWVPLPPDPP